MPRIKYRISYQSEALRQKYVIVPTSGSPRFKLHHTQPFLDISTYTSIPFQTINLEYSCPMVIALL